MNEDPRKIRFSTIISILKKRPISLFLGLLCTFLPLFLMVLFVIVFSNFGNETPDVDFDMVENRGEEYDAVITDLETQYNITINGVHPTIIHYSYEKGATLINSKYRVLEDRKIDELGIGDQIIIKDFEGDSIVNGLDPYEVDLPLLLFIPSPFLIVGIPFLIYALFHLRSELELYRHGKVKQASIVSMIPKSGLPISGMGSGIIVYYAYSIDDNKHIGESTTDDFSLISDYKKNDVIPIFVSEVNPTKSSIVPKLESIRNGWNIEFDG